VVRNQEFLDVFFDGPVYLSSLALQTCGYDPPSDGPGCVCNASTPATSCTLGPDHHCLNLTTGTTAHTPPHTHHRTHDTHGRVDGSVEFHGQTAMGEEMLFEVLVPACRSVVVAVVPSAGDVDLYVGWHNVTHPSPNGYFEASVRYGSLPEYVVLCCGSYTGRGFPSGLPIYLNVRAYTNSSWTLHVYDMSAPIPIEPLYPFGTLQDLSQSRTTAHAHNRTHARVWSKTRVVWHSERGGGVRGGRDLRHVRGDQPGVRQRGPHRPGPRLPARVVGLDRARTVRYLASNAWVGMGWRDDVAM
jgi:hypothetical protein